MRARHRLDNGQPDARATVRQGRWSPAEALEEASFQGVRHTRASIKNADRRRRSRHLDLDLTAFGGIMQGISHEVVDGDAQKPCMAVDDAIRFTIDGQSPPGFHGFRTKFHGLFHHDRAQMHGLEACSARGVSAGKIDQLLEDAVKPRQILCEAGLDCGVRNPVDAGSQDGQGRANLMCDVGGKVALRVQALLQSVESTVHSQHKRTNLGWHILL